MNNYNLEKIIAIPENAGLSVSKEKIEIVGPNRPSVFVKGKKVCKSGFRELT